MMTVLTRSETNRLRIHLRQIDPHAFITIVNSSEIIGKASVLSDACQLMQKTDFSITEQSDEA